MSGTREKELKIRLVGDDPDLRRNIRDALMHGLVRNLSWSKLHDMILSHDPNFLLVIELKVFTSKEEDQFLKWRSDLASTSPLLYFSAPQHGTFESFSLFTRL